MPRKKKSETAPTKDVKAETKAKKTKNTDTVQAAPVAVEKPEKKSTAKKAETAKKTTTAKKETAAKSEPKTEKVAEVKTEEVVKAPKAEKTTKTTKTAKTSAKSKTAPSDAVKVQFGVDEYDVESIKKAVEADFRSKFSGHYKNVQIYIKPEEKTAYYVVNSKFSDKIAL